MEEKGREAKRARTLRTDYAAEVEALEAWLRSAELAARDRTLEPQPLAERLASARREAAAAGERAERAAALGRGIGEGTRDARERQVLARTASALAEQLAAVCAELEARRAAAGDACDAWARFLRLLEAVRAWVATQKTFLAQPLHVTSLDETRHRLNDYSVALKSCKQQTKNLSEMAKELEAIEQVASVGDLPAKLEEAETSKVEVEKQLMQRNALLQELTEEWEQCERKMKDVTNWIDKTRQTLDSSQNKKKPLRDQHALREKILGDVPIQKTKISISVEKLQVHFRSGVEGSPGPVEETARRLQAELDAVGEATGAQATALAGALAQLDAYAQEVQRLRGDVLRADQQLRAALAPNYTRDADTAHRHQQDSLCSDIEELLRQVCQTEDELGDLPQDSLQSMMSGLLEGIASLRANEQEATALEKKLLQLEQDAEVQGLNANLAGIRTRIVTLLSQAEKGINTIQIAMKTHEDRTKEVTEYKILIEEIEIWLLSVTKNLSTTKINYEELDTEEVERQITKHEILLNEFDIHSQKLDSLCKSCCEVQAHSNVEKLAKNLIDQLKKVTEVMNETKDHVVLSINKLKERRHDLEVKSVECVSICDNDISQTDKTIDSSPMPEEEVTPSKMDLEPIVIDTVRTVQSPAVHIAVETQTGKSLLGDQPETRDRSITCEPEIPKMQDVAVTCAPPQHVEVQTGDKEIVHPGNVSENIIIRQTVSKDHDTIEIASKPIIEEPDDDRDIKVDASYKDTEEFKDTQLNITHSQPQTFETLMVEPDATTTEVIVDADGTKRIIVRRLRRTVVTQQQTVHQQHIQHQSHIMSSGEIVPESQSFSQVTLQENKSSSSVFDPDGNKQHLEMHSYGGRIVSGVPGGEVTVEEFSSNPDCTINVEKNVDPQEVVGSFINVSNQPTQLDPHVQTSSSSVTAVVQQVTRRVIKRTKRIIRKVIIIDGKEHVTEEVIEEPDDIDVTEEEIPRVTINVYKSEGGNVIVEENDNGPRSSTVTKIDKTPSNSDDTSDTDDKLETSNQQTEIKTVISDVTKVDKGIDLKDHGPNVVPIFVPKEVQKGTPEVIQDTTTEVESQIKITSPKSDEFSRVDEPQNEPDLPAVAFEQERREIEEIPNESIVETIPLPSSLDFILAEKAHAEKNVNAVVERIRSEKQLPKEIQPKNEEVPETNIFDSVYRPISPNSLLVDPKEIKDTSDITKVDEEIQDTGDITKVEETMSAEVQMPPDIQEKNVAIVTHTVVDTSQPSVAAYILDVSQVDKTEEETYPDTSTVLKDIENMKEDIPTSNLIESLPKPILSSSHDISLTENIQDKISKDTIITPLKETEDAKSSQLKMDIIESVHSEDDKKATISLAVSEIDNNESKDKAHNQPQILEYVAQVNEELDKNRTHISELAIASEPKVPKEHDTDINKPQKMEIKESDLGGILIDDTSSRVEISKTRLLKEEKTVFGETDIQNLNEEDNKIKYAPMNILIAAEQGKSALFQTEDVVPRAHEIAAQTVNENIAFILAESERPMIPTDIIQKDKENLESKEKLPAEELVPTKTIKDPVSLKDVPIGGPLYTVEMSVSIDSRKIEPSSNEPKISLSLKMENDQKGVELADVVRKEIEVELPHSQKVVEVPPKKDAGLVVDEKDFTKSSPRDGIEIGTKRNRKRKKHKEEDDFPQFEPHVSEPAESLTKPVEELKEVDIVSKIEELKPEPTMEVELEVKTLDLDEVIEPDNKEDLSSTSTSLDQYMESPPKSLSKIESPKPTEPENFDSFSLQSSSVALEDDYEPEEISSKSITPIEPPKHKVKKKKQIVNISSETTAYPEVTSDDTNASSENDRQEIVSKSSQRKKKNKKQKDETPEKEQSLEPQIEAKQTIPEPCFETTENVPQDDSYHTISDPSDYTVKIVEECIPSSPDSPAKSNICETIAYTVPVLETVATQEYSAQTSPDLSISPDVKIVEEEKIEQPVVVESFVQTSPVAAVDSDVQVTPEQGIELAVQTSPEPKVETTSSTVQTVLEEQTINETVNLQKIEPIETVESSIQVSYLEMNPPEDRFSQTSSPIPLERQDTIAQTTVVEMQTTEMQTSPRSEIYEKPETTSNDAEIQTPITEIDDKTQQTSPEPLDHQEQSEKHVHDISMQTVSPEITQIQDEITQVVTSELVPNYDTAVQTQVVVKPDVIATKDVANISSQTSPRKDYSEKDDTTSSSTDEPYEIHLHAQITLPDSKKHIQFSEEFLNNEIASQSAPMLHGEDNENYEDESIFIDKSKRARKKKKQKRKPIPSMAESHIESPESLSDPITTELSISVTPSIDESSSKDISLDEGISPQSNTNLSSPDNATRSTNFIKSETDFYQKPPSGIQPTKLSYSEVTKRSKSPTPERKDASVSPAAPEYKTFVPGEIDESTYANTELIPSPTKHWLTNLVEKRTENLRNSTKSTKLNDIMYSAIIHNPDISYEDSVRKELRDIESAIETKNTILIEQHIFITIETISEWLEIIEYKITNIVQKSGQNPSATANEMSSIRAELKKINEDVDLVKKLAGRVDDKNENVTVLCGSLNSQLKAIEGLADETKNRVVANANTWNDFIERVHVANKLTNDLKYRLDNILISDIPNKEKVENLDQCENLNRNYMINSENLLQSARNIMRQYPNKEYPEEIYHIQDTIKQVESMIIIERDRLLQTLALADEYEQTLRDFEQITEVANALVDNRIIVSNLEQLHEEIQQHRKFFVNLSHCRAILESLEGNLDSETRAKFSALHHTLHDRAAVILDKAAGRAQQMGLAASRWTVLEQGLKEENQWLRVANQRVPELTNVTSIDQDQYINLYQSLSSDISHHHAKLLRLLSISKGLQDLVSCPEVENKCIEPLEAVTALQDDINNDLSRLNAFRECWSSYDYLTDRVEGWMKIAEKELSQISPDLSPPSHNLRQFWELKAQHEVHDHIKKEAGVNFERALEILPIADEMSQRQIFSKVDEQWRNLTNNINAVQTAAIQNIADPEVTTADKLNILEEELRELRTAVENIQGIIKSEDELDLYLQRLQVMSGRIERIQNELGRLGLLPAFESERVGSLLGRARRLDVQISEELEGGKLLKEKLLGIQQGLARVRRNHNKAQATLDECEANERMESDVVERAAAQCAAVGDDLAEGWRELLALRQLLHTLPLRLRVSVSPVHVEREVSRQQDEHARLEARCSELLALLRARCALWRRFEKQLELVQQSVQEADYMIELLTVQGQVDYDRLLKATERLEGLSGSLERRGGELVGELRSAATPLLASTDAAVAERLRADVERTAVAYDATRTNLKRLCEKYSEAVRLWRQYRDASAAVRAWADEELARAAALDPDHALEHVKVCEERLAVQDARVRELQALAERVSRETGGDALRADAAALGARLEAVRRSARALADVGEARAQRRVEAVREAKRAREMLGSVQKSLATVEEAEGEKGEEQLITLREHLLSLGKSEGRILNAKDTSAELGPAATAETSIVEILELWQHMFRDTFQQYHRLSSSLVKTRDAETALRLWREYLLNVQSFLSGTIPDDYHNLTEHQRLCEVHQNLLATQKSTLLSNGDRLSADDTEEHVAEKFNMLTNLHNETLSHVVDRHAQVSARIAAWERYRTDQALMLQWLRDVEREKEKLHLRYIHIRRVPKVLARIELLLEKVPAGTAQADNLLGQQKRILQFCDEGFSASIRMELAGIVKRIENIQAGLETWRDYLIKIIDLIATYDELTNKLQNNYNDIQNDLSNMSDVTQRAEPKRLIEQLRKYKIEVGKSTSDLDALSVVQEQLKECLSPQDVKSINQRLWLLRQQQADLDHQLSVLMHQVQEKLELDIIFDSRRTRLINWITELEIRLDKGNQLGSMGAINPQELVRKIETELQSEMALKEREYEWVMAAGKELYDEAGDSDDRKQYKADLLKKVEEVRDRWSRLKEIGKSRINKINDLLLTIFQLEERLVEIRVWICQTESQLVAPIVLERPTRDEVERKLAEHDAVQKSIESESGEIAEVLNLCELLLNDVDTWRGNFDTQNLKTNMDFVDKKWRTICEMSAARKNNLYEMLKLLQILMDAGRDDEQWVLDVDSRLCSIEDILDDISQADKAAAGEKAQKLREEIESRDEALRSLEEKYSKLAKSGLEVENLQRLLAPVRETLNRWRGLEARMTRVLGALRQETAAHRRFIDAHGQAVVGLTQVDVRLTRLQHLSRHPDDLPRQLAELQGVQDELESYGQLLHDTDELGLALMQNARAEEVASIQEMIDEYQSLWKDISVRIERMRRARRPERDEQVQVETLKFERDSATQVNTLPPLSRVTSMTSRDAYAHELSAAVGECDRNLSALEAALAGGEPTRDSPELREATAALSKRAALAQSNVELVAHLSELLLTEFECGEEESRLKEVEALKLRYGDLLGRAKKREVHVRNLHEAGRLTCPLCSQRNWKQLDNDLWRLEQWLQAAEARQETRRAPPSRIDELEDAIQDHREFLLDLDGHRAIVVSLNVVGDHLAEHAGSAARARELRARLAGDNSRWDAACAAAGAWQARLQAALLSNAEFHRTLEELGAWLTRAERQTRAAEPLQLLAPADVLAARFHHFTELRGELERAEPRVLALQEAADQLLRVEDAPEGAHEICKNTSHRLSELRLRLHALRRLAAVYALRLGAALARARPGADLAASLAAAAAVQLVDQAETLEAPPALPSTDEQTDDDVDTGVLVRSMRFLTRVARAALPFQALLLLLLGAAALLPGARDSDACARAPPGLEPVLRYPHGPPPM